MEIDVLGKKGLITGTNGTGKTYFASRFAEMIRSTERVPVLVYADNKYDFEPFANKDKKAPYHIINKPFSRHDFDNVAEDVFNYAVEHKKKGNKGVVFVIDEFQRLCPALKPYSQQMSRIFSMNRHVNLGIIAIAHRMQGVYLEYYSNTQWNVFFKQPRTQSTKKALSEFFPGVYEEVVNLRMEDYQKVVHTQLMNDEKDLIILDRNNAIVSTTPRHSAGIQGLP